jgi:hypothetical protein
MGFKQDSYRILAEQLIRKFSERNMDAAYFATAEECRNAILQEIPEGASVTWGGSMTIILQCDASSNVSGAPERAFSTA